MFAVAGIKTGCDKKKGTKVPVSLCVCFAERQAAIKERNQKGKCLFVCVCALLSKSEME